MEPSNAGCAGRPPGRARQSYPNVMEVHGTVRTGGDTLSIRLGDLRTGNGSVPDVSGRIALLPAAESERSASVGSRWDEPSSP